MDSILSDYKETAFIWDLDGTLIDSYGVIVGSIVDMLTDIDFVMEEKTVLEHIKRFSSGHFFRSIAGRVHRSETELFDLYRVYTHGRDDQIQLILHAYDTLEKLKREGARHFIYTHRGSSTIPILKRLGIDHFFEEVVTHEAGFPSKPAPDGLDYLIDKYGLERNRVFYVGDRNLDVQCGNNAHVHTILFLDPESCVIPDGTEGYIVNSLDEINQKILV